MPEILKESPSEVAEHFGLRLANDLFSYPLIEQRSPLLPYEFAKKRLLIALEEQQDYILIAHADPLALDAVQEARRLLKKPLKELFAPKEAIEKAIQECYHQKETVTSEWMASMEESDHSDEKESLEHYDLLKEQNDSSPIVKMLNAILLQAIRQGASDIHFEPMETDFAVRYRIDGVLQLRHSPAKQYQAQLIARIKVLARLDIAESRLPQDGRIKLRLGEREVDFRVSTIPVVYGERVVLRILDRSNVILGLHKLGIRTDLFESFNKLIHLSEGIILVTGPTGSGKTTTLYSTLSEIHSPKINIMTIEDPVEYKLQAMAQIGVNPKIQLTFQSGLRHILRQDPDVIMIGEIRDRETAEIAIQSSLTGHLVFSTLHTNDAPSALTRLVEMGIEPYLLSSSVLGVMAQRLVRCICTHCRESYVPSDSELNDLGLLREELKDGVLFSSAGCDHCYGTGYKGRRGIYELMTVNGPIKKQLLTSPDSTGLQKIALACGMKTLRQDGALLVINGVTSSEEVLRVTRNLEE